MTFVQLTLLQRGVLNRVRALGERQYADMLEESWKRGAPLAIAKVDLPADLVDDVARANGQAKAE